MREEKEGLRDAITAVLDAVDGTQHGNNFSLASLIMFGPSTPLHGQVLGRYMDPANPLHDLAHELWKKRAVINPYWVNRGATG